MDLKLKLELAASMLREMISLCELGDLDETTNDGLGWAGLIEDAKRWLSDQPAQNFVPRLELDAANDAHRRMVKAEHALSQAYIRLRLRIPNAMYPPSELPENIWQHTEACLDRLALQAARYEFIRQQNWSDSNLCVVANPKRAVRLGHDCPSGERLDELIDNGRAAKPNGGAVSTPPDGHKFTYLETLYPKVGSVAELVPTIPERPPYQESAVLATPSVHDSIEAYCWARDLDWESYCDAHRKSNCKGGLLCREAYSLFCQAMQAQMWYDQSGHGITVFTKDAEARDQAARDAHARYERSVADARRAKLQEVTDKLSNLRRATIGNVVHYLDETGQTVATVSRDLLDEHNAHRASDEVPEPPPVPRDEVSYGQYESWRAGWTAGYQACLSARRASPSDEAAKD